MVRSIKEEHGIKSRRHKRIKITTDSNHNKLVYLNMLNQQFDANRPNESWVSDIIYIWTNEGWLYLAGVNCPGIVGDSKFWENTTMKK